MKKPLVVSVILLIYLIVMAVVVFPIYQKSGDWIRYFLIIAGQLVIIGLLHFFNVKKEKLKEQKKSRS